MNSSDRLLLAVDLAGIFFAVEGAMAVIEGNPDFFRAKVLSFATASADGIIRDLLIGASSVCEAFATTESEL
jgi:uncharacterized membrane protein YeiH